jgi:hypothetical protein
MIDALEHGAIKPARLSAGNANGQLFFDTACCGLLPQLWQFRQAFADAETFSERWQAVARATALSRFLVRPNIHFRVAAQRRGATALLIRARHESSAGPAVQAQGNILTCEAWRQGTFDALISAAFRADWRQAPAQNFTLPELVIENRRPTWLLLDGQPVRFKGRITMNRVAGAVQTFAFGHAPQLVKQDLVTDRRHSFYAGPVWKDAHPAAVGKVEPRNIGQTRH